MKFNLSDHFLMQKGHERIIESNLSAAREFGAKTYGVICNVERDFNCFGCKSSYSATFLLVFYNEKGNSLSLSYGDSCIQWGSITPMKGVVLESMASRKLDFSSEIDCGVFRENLSTLRQEIVDVFLILESEESRGLIESEKGLPLDFPPPAASKDDNTDTRAPEYAHPIFDTNADYDSDKADAGSVGGVGLLMSFK